MKMRCCDSIQCAECGENDNHCRVCKKPLTQDDDRIPLAALAKQMQQFKELIEGKKRCLVCDSVDSHWTKECPMIKCCKCEQTGHPEIFCPNGSLLQQQQQQQQQQLQEEHQKPRHCQFPWKRASAAVVCVEAETLEWGNGESRFFQLLQLAAVHGNKVFYRVILPETPPSSMTVVGLDLRRAVGEREALEDFVQFCSILSNDTKATLHFFVSHYEAIWHPVVLRLQRFNLLGRFLSVTRGKVIVGDLRTVLATELNYSYACAATLVRFKFNELVGLIGKTDDYRSSFRDLPSVCEALLKMLREIYHCKNVDVVKPLLEKFHPTNPWRYTLNLNGFTNSIQSSTRNVASFSVIN